MKQYKAVRGEIRDEEGTQICVIVPSNCTKKFRDRITKTLVGILNAEERGKLANKPANAATD